MTFCCNTHVIPRSEATWESVIPTGIRIAAAPLGPRNDRGKCKGEGTEQREGTQAPPYNATAGRGCVKTDAPAAAVGRTGAPCCIVSDGERGQFSRIMRGAVFALRGGSCRAERGDQSSSLGAFG